MHSRVQISLAHTTHAAAISGVICDAIRKANAKDYPPAEIDRLLKNFTTARVAELMRQRVTFVAQHGDRVVGTGSLQGAEIKSVFVSPGLHRRGIGTALMQVLEDTAIERGQHALSVSSSLSAIPFYTSLGYAEQRREFFGNEETVLMQKSLV